MNKRMCGPSFETPRKDARLLRMTRHVTAYWLAMTELSIGAGARLRCQLCERRGQIVRRQHREIGEFAGLERAALVVVVGHEGRIAGVHFQRLTAARGFGVAAG